MENREVNEQILRVWKNNFEKIKGFSNGKIDWPLLIPNFNDSPLLFLGLNPSKDKNEKYKINKEEDLDDKGKIVSIISQEEDNLRNGGYGKYFSTFEKISEKVCGKKSDFNHIDLYFYRMTNSKNFIPLTKKHTGVFKEQLDISIDAIKRFIRPEVIFVANKNASQIIRTEFKIEDVVFEVDGVGFDIIEVGGKKIPIFFSGMISSARSIDDYTLERVVWHIKRAIKWYKDNNK